MRNFEYKNPVKLIFGKDQTSKIASEIPAGSKVLMTYGGGSIKKNGVYDQVIEALKDFEVLEFGGIEANPEFTTLMKAVNLARENKVDYLLAVGGGSVIDGTKFISAAIPYDGDDEWDILAKSLGRKLKSAVPFGTVLTIPATGSEANSGAVVSRSEIKEKRTFGGPMFFPQFSVLDPQVVRTLPKRQIANGTADAFWHVLEQYLTYPAGAPIQDRIAEGILNTLVEVGPKVIADPNDYEAAANLMYSATMALNGQIQQGVPTDWATHMIGHELTALFGIDHARTLSIIGPNLFRVMFENKKEKLVQYGERVWNITEGTEDERAQKAIEKTVEFLESLGIQTKISDYTSDYSEASKIIADRFKERNWLGMGERQDITPEKVVEIVEMSI
ncbi:iron-containing alcohol dehydrogenase [Sediminitomix flava]|uniref:NADP-dependent alcohol dehydrogenase n=1 Tax=Sediminitomix flava TaxID=379075 RepID=A0A315ZIH4_SEDFL|nr:iron-containing alcohol dehydrogenase [Sediminitomix flava]PWJ45013.1 NADP-dependent alcohol dehydrogenase [Sediminitomix flava]